MASRQTPVHDIDIAARLVELQGPRRMAGGDSKGGGHVFLAKAQQAARDGGGDKNTADARRMKAPQDDRRHHGVLEAPHQVVAKGHGADDILAG